MRQDRGICVIDLDTVMPGLSVNDFGGIRSVSAQARRRKDEIDHGEKQAAVCALFEVYNNGFQKGCRGRLTDTGDRDAADGSKDHDV